MIGGYDIFIGSANRMPLVVRSTGTSIVLDTMLGTSQICLAPP
jgi:hypothetical protein